MSARLVAVPVIAFFLAGVLVSAAAPPVFAEDPKAPAKESPKPPARDPAAGAKPADPPADAQGGEAGKKEHEFEPVTVTTATRTRTEAFSLSRFLTIVDEDEFRRLNLNVAVDSLGLRIGTWVEHRTGTTGDPVIRGLSGGNLLALVDGCSLSTFWGEGGFAGDDMYGKIDPDCVERIEVIRGPGSAMYGSQALGAVINFITRSCPFDFPEEGSKSGVRGTYKYTSGNTGFSWRAEAFGACPGFRFLVGGSFRDLNDVRAGGDVGVQKRSGGEDHNFDMKYEFKLAEGHVVSVAYQDVHRTHIQRFYRPTQDNTNDREAVTVTYKAEKLSDLLAEIVFKQYFQKKVDRRRWKLIDSNPRIGFSRIETHQSELQATMKFDAAGEHNLTAGVAYHLDRGESADDEQFTYRKAGWTIGPPGERMDSPITWWHNFGVFVHDRWKDAMVKGLSIEASARYDYFYFWSDPFHSRYYPVAYTSNPFAYASLEEAQRNDDFVYDDHVITGGIGATYGVLDWLNAVVNLNVGYRHWPPAFGVTQHGNNLFAPDTEAADVYSYTGEAGLKWKHRKFEGEAVAYYTWWDGFAEYSAGTFMGQDWFDWNGNGTQDSNEGIYTRKNSGQAYVYGVEIEGTWRFKEDFDLLFGWGKGWWDGLSLYGGFMWNYGVDLAHRVGTSHYEPIRQTHPARCLLSLKWEEPESKDAWFSLTADMVGKFDRIPNSRENDVAYWRNPQSAAGGKIRADGLPGYTVWHFNSGWKATENLTLTLGCENIFNRKYRRAHSRADEMGANVILGMDVKF